MGSPIDSIFLGSPPRNLGNRVTRSVLLATVGLLSSLVVDNQVVDVDPSRSEMLYHCVRVPPEDVDAYELVNGPVERLVSDQGATR